ncbi:queuine tRNA-ribosyltransferase accessory subunit 2-like [Strongylocentrotus purpuratus]|uniref:tRNA-guanine(15) transglycosylase-like domain-containing protein n=1 Tax=Strongylocentrotus purpuratus TaxID=7668 RepID=A0A7M7PMV9_STRPU|nr:queuine tRNA-ribosyltransferase accessory subunit 2-like [Strongylocentrotus purpuratus]
MTQRGGWALVFPCEVPPAHSQVIVDADSTGLSQLQQVKDASDVQGENDQIDPRFELNLSEKRFAEDFSPVLNGCDCYCCTHHTKAYINHLLNVNELLARVLLMDHNCHHYFEFFHSIRTSLKDGTFQKLKEAIVNNR